MEFYAGDTVHLYMEDEIGTVVSVSEKYVEVEVVTPIRFLWWTTHQTKRRICAKGAGVSKITERLVPNGTVALG